jgi:threonine dehydratase
MTVPLDLAAIRQAHDLIRNDILRTPLWSNDALSAELGAPIYFKLENLQRTGSFKLRGATHKIHQLLAAGARPIGVIAASAGNHAQGVARAALVAGLPATVVMPGNAPLTKIAACKAMGATVVLIGNTLEEARAEAQSRADAGGLAFIHPYDDWDIIAGQASCGLEILDELPDADLLVVPLGGGGLIAGIALAAKSIRPGIHIVGVQADTVAPYRHFLEDGGVDAIPIAAHTIADGIKVKIPGTKNRQLIARYVDEIVTVSDNAIAEAMVTVLERTRTIGEGAGVVGLAALMRGAVRPRPDEKTVVVVSGGNVDMTLVGRSIDYGLTSSGRLMALAVSIPDTPGRLAGLLGAVAEHGMNIRHVEHRRGELHVPVGVTQVILHIETRDFDHQKELLDHFAAQGIAAHSLLDETRP